MPAAKSGDTTIQPNVSIRYVHMIVPVSDIEMVSLPPVISEIDS